MKIEWIPLLSFVIATTFSPGPNNISSASMGIIYGYKRTVTYLLGISSGFFLVMLLCAFLSSTLLGWIPSLHVVLRWVGAFYILWLAYGIIQSSHTIDDDRMAPRAFIKGFLLQLLNPKAMVYGLTLFSTFLASVSGHFGPLIAFSAGFAVTAFVATSTWALGGTYIKEKLKNDTFKRNINWGLAMLLFYTAMDLSGLLERF